MPAKHEWEEDSYGDVAHESAAHPLSVSAQSTLQVVYSTISYVHPSGQIHIPPRSSEPWQGLHLPHVNHPQATPSPTLNDYQSFTSFGMYQEPANAMYLHGQPQRQNGVLISHQTGMSHQQVYYQPVFYQQTYYQQPQYQQPNQQHPFVVHSHDMHGFQAAHSGSMASMPPQMNGGFQLMAPQQMALPERHHQGAAIVMHHQASPQLPNWTTEPIMATATRPQQRQGWSSPSTSHIDPRLLAADYAIEQQQRGFQCRSASRPEEPLHSRTVAAALPAAKEQASLTPTASGSRVAQLATPLDLQEMENKEPEDNPWPGYHLTPVDPSAEQCTSANTSSVDTTTSSPVFQYPTPESCVNGSNPCARSGWYTLKYQK
jgi:hypothetical protein